MKVASSRMPLRLPLVDVVALHHALPAAHLLRVARADPGGGVDVEVAPELGAAPMPERSSSSGVPSAPPAPITARLARTA